MRYSTLIAALHIAGSCPGQPGLVQPGRRPHAA
ncbi:hypothetical protein FOMA001_g19955 [Fusarium oxysporum f. sp. matthiolae]|nr:hypothetical protein FOMA001_g19955 [Fusarium oxysporum f. sp. matthiolae]